MKNSSILSSEIEETLESLSDPGWSLYQTTGDLLYWN